MPWHPCACCTYCPHALSGTAPGQFQIDIEGLAAAVPETCADCFDLNASYILDKGGAAVPGAFGGCWYDYPLDPPVCNVARVVLGIGVYTDVPPVWIVIVYLVDAAGNILAAAKKTYAGDRPDVRNFAGEDLGTLDFYFVSLGCNVAGSSVIVSAVRPCYQKPATFDPDAFDGETFA